MSITVSLIIQSLAFFAVAWVVMRFGWPHIMASIEERQKKIADGLAAADKGAKSLSEAKEAANDIIKAARDQAGKIVDQAGRRSNEMIDEAKTTASAEGQRLIGEAKQEVALESNRARALLSKEVATLAVSGASKLLGREIDAKAHADLLDKLALEIERG